MVQEVTVASLSLPRLGAQISPQGSRVLMSLAIMGEELERRICMKRNRPLGCFHSLILPLTWKEQEPPFPVASG